MDIPQLNPLYRAISISKERRRNRLEALTLVVPMAGELEKGANGEAWQELRERVFFALRYILTCKPRARPDTPKMGEIEADLGGVLGTSSFRDKLTVTTVTRDQKTALTKFFQSSEELAKISSSLATEFLPIGGPKFNMSADASTKFAQAFAASRDRFG